MCVGFFHQIAPPDPIRDTLGRFRFFLKIRGDIREKVGSAVYDTPRNGISALYLTPRNLPYKFFKFLGYDTPPNCNSAVYHTPRNGDSAVYLTPLKGNTAEVMAKIALL